MNRRDAAMIAHLDAMEGRITAHLVSIETRLDTVVDAIADLRVDLAAHIADGHGGS